MENQSGDHLLSMIRSTTSRIKKRVVMMKAVMLRPTLSTEQLIE